MSEHRSEEEVEEEQSLVDRLAKNLFEYIELKMKYYKLVAYEKSAKMITMLIAAIIMIGFFLCCYVLINVALGFVLSDIIGSFKWGFAIVAFVNLLLAVVIVIFRNQLILNPMINATILMIMKKDKDE